MSELLVKGALAYLLGSVVGSLLIGRLAGGVDIRSLGSGNAGATNALRTLGKKVAFCVLAIDVAKGWIATGWLVFATLPAVAAAPPEWRAWGTPVCGLAVMLGHIYPVWYGFRGGKGMATLVGAVLGVSPWLLLPMIVIWLATVVISGFVGLASILASCALAVALAVTSAAGPLKAFGIAAALLVLFTHRSNIARMRAGTESRARRLWLLGRRTGQA
jgi:acyl phosphate:glycerol-3-phosphate acyltransferase